MDKVKFATLMEMLRAAYPNRKFLENTIQIGIWYEALFDLEIEQLERAVRVAMATLTFPPSIAELRQLAVQDASDIRDWSQGWDVVMQAMREYGLYRIDDALQFVKSIDNMAYQIIKRLGFQNICMSEDLSIERSNFRMAYINSQKHESYQKQLPERLKIQLVDTQQGERLSIEGYNGEDEYI